MLNDDEFLREMREMQAKNDRILNAARILEQEIRAAIQHCCIDADLLYGDEVGSTVDFVHGMCASADGKTDMLKAIQILLFSAWRYADGTLQGVIRRNHPASTEDPDEPIQL